MDVDSYQMQIINLLNIPALLTICPKGSVDVHLAYTKYQGYLQAHSDMLRMLSDGSWTLKRPSSDELVEVFVSKSVWHANYSKLFPKARGFPAVLKWLEHGHDLPSNMDIFGVEKQSYSFRDLREVLDDLEVIRTTKGKRKAKDSVDEGSQKKKQKKSSSSKHT
jgi:hypothetical protein